LCGRLPLAIRIAAARLRSHPSWELAHLVGRLRDRQSRLVELEAGQRSVTAALDLSYQDLDPGQRRTYRLLGLPPGPDIDAYAVAALLDGSLLEAERMLEQLLEAHLLQETVPGRYRFHDLTRAHAAHTAAQDPEDDRRLALDRLLDYYRHAAAVAMDAAYPYDRHDRPRVPLARTPIPALTDRTTALAWLDREVPDLLTAAGYATEHDRPVHLLHLSTTLHRYLRNRGPYHDVETLHQHALTAARTLGDQAGETEALVCLGHIYRLQSGHEQAIAYYQQALLLARAAGHQAAELDALTGLGHTHSGRIRHDQAAEYFTQALALARAIADRTAEQDTLTGLGHIHRIRGRYELATDHYQQALRLAQAAGHVTGEMNALNSIGKIHRMQGRYEQAAERYQHALRLARSAGQRDAQQVALTGLAWVHRLQGNYNQAAQDYQQLLDLTEQTGNRNWQLEAWHGLGRLHHATGQAGAALTDHGRALALAIELDQPDDGARAHDGLAHAHHALAQAELARAHWQQALDTLARLGIDRVDEIAAAAIRANLDRLATDLSTLDRL
jgi:tetratricopeptide (TPR) repeat protein